jgi:hypothetical protein
MHTSVRTSQEPLTSGEHIAESILSLLDEPDSSDKRWRALIFQRLPERFAENAAHEYKETYIFEGRRNANQSLLKAYGKSNKHSIPLNASDDDLQVLSKRIVMEIKDFSNFLLNRTDKIASLLHYAQKYDINLPSLDNPSITEKGGLYSPDR